MSVTFVHHLFYFAPLETEGYNTTLSEMQTHLWQSACVCNVPITLAPSFMGWSLFGCVRTWFGRRRRDVGKQFPAACVFSLPRNEPLRRVSASSVQPPYILKFREVLSPSLVYRLDGAGCYETFLCYTLMTDLSGSPRLVVHDWWSTAWQRLVWTLSWSPSLACLGTLLLSCEALQENI